MHQEFWLHEVLNFSVFLVSAICLSCLIYTVCNPLWFIFVERRSDWYFVNVSNLHDLIPSCHLDQSKSVEAQCSRPTTSWRREKTSKCSGCVEMGGVVLKHWCLRTGALKKAKALVSS